MTARTRGRARALAARIDAATPPHRDRAVDALRALAITGVILGHWLVTALVLTRGGPGTVLPAATGATAHAAGPLAGVTLRDASPLATMPALAPLSWIFQTLAVFFFVGGYAAARSCPASGREYPAWLGRRLARLSWPVLILLGVWALAAAGLWLAGVPGPVLGTVLKLVLSPLWFLVVYAGLTALTPLAVALVRRLGPAAAALPAAVVAGTDAVRFGLGGPAWAGWVNVAAGWLVPYLLGIAWARGAFRGRAAAVVMLGTGAAATAALVAWAGYPASMVGVNGAAISNLNPPSLAAVTFGVAQVGLALLAAGPLRRLLRRPAAWAVVALVNLSAMTLFLWHQTAMLTVSLAGLGLGRLPGLLTAPAGPLWVAERLAWLPAFAGVLAAAWLLLRRAERPPATGRGRAGEPGRDTLGQRDRLRGLGGRRSRGFRAGRPGGRLVRRDRDGLQFRAVVGGVDREPGAVAGDDLPDAMGGERAQQIVGGGEQLAGGGARPRVGQ
jgi:hypothetical protein